MAKQKLDRRDFAKHSTVAVGGLVAGSLLDAVCAQDPGTTAPDKRLLLLGLNALARAHKMNYFADGHRGAAMVSAYLMCVDNKLDGPATKRIAELIDINWAKTALCKPFPDQQPVPSRVGEIGAALLEGSEVLRQVGHNAIFAMLAIKAFRMMPDAATPDRIDGVCKMIRLFKPWRDVEPDANVLPPPFADSVEASRFVLREADAAIDRFVGFGQGFAGHMVTFGQALIELAAMGDVEWAEGCRRAFCKYVTVTRRGPQADEKRRPDHQPTKLRPTDAQYWQNRGVKTLGLGHVLKYPYAYYDLVRRAKDPDLQRKMDAKAYHLF